MADRYRKRQPLSELRNRSNPPSAHRTPITTPSVVVKAVTASPQVLLHNESLEPNGTLAVRSSRPSSPAAQQQQSQPSKRAGLSPVATEQERDPKRNSAISTTSTNTSVRRRKTYIGHWQLGRTIGKGGCSRVRVVRHKTTQQYGAVKIITRSTAESTRAQSLANLIESTKFSQPPPGYRPIPYGLEREIAVMKLLEHPNIVRLYDVWENRNELYLIMEYVDGGELFHYVDDRKGLYEDESVYIFRQIISALLYCHRLLICHRDLKPENILLNQKDLTVKLIDFGMAALQPEGRLLSTPCGSPHYAAPEVVSSKPYDGKQADVWSCGVILYVMLTGTTPFNYPPEGDIRVLFRDIARANYWLPPDLSPEAQDLIRRIFVPNPKNRITMDEIWDHPLLHKYDRQFGLEGSVGSKEAAIGPIPTLTDFKLKRIQDIDREILRNMRTLWHSEPENGLIQKLLNNEINQEKLFYAALIKHREENLENYSGGDDFDCSKSDYHHNQPFRSFNPPAMPTLPAQRTQSQYSIMNDEHLRSSSSMAAVTPSISSYDPYRASKNPIVDPRSQNDVLIHHKGNSARRPTTARALRHPSAMRVEVLKQTSGGKRFSVPSSSSLAHSARSRSSMRRSSISRVSILSAGLASSPPVIVKIRPSDAHKRGVSFSHLRRASTVSALTAPLESDDFAPPTPSLPDTFREKRANRSSHPTPPVSSPPETPSGPHIRARKEKPLRTETLRGRVRDGDTPGQYMRNDIRKHSAELEKACEEAFFRSSVGSSLTSQTMGSEKATPGYETPPSSISARGSGGNTGPITDYELRMATAAAMRTPRPSPAAPQVTPNTYLTRTLEETRKKLAAYPSAAGDTNAAKFDEVMRMLENIMPPSGTSFKRTASAPVPRSSESHGSLPIIAEESEDRSTRNWHRSVTAPGPPNNDVDSARDQTIRVVQSSSPLGTIPPLNVRKSINASSSPAQSAKAEAALAPPRSHAAYGEHMPDSSAMEEDYSTFATTSAPTTTVTNPPVVRKKKSAWFGLSKKTAVEATAIAAPVTPNTHGVACHGPVIDHRSSRLLSKSPPANQQLAEPLVSPPLVSSSDNTKGKKRMAGGGGAKKGFAKWLGRKDAEPSEPTSSSGVEQPAGETSLTDTRGRTTTTRRRRSPSHDSLFSDQSPGASGQKRTARPASSSPAGAEASGPERSWFARFFHLKPATQILCFSVPRGKARQELVLLLRAWEAHGLADVTVSRARNTLSARVDKVNALNIKPVTFRVELFVVLEHGKRVGLSLARFEMLKGAASAFRKVVEVVDEVMRAKGWLVQDEEKCNALCEIVGG